MLKLLLGREQAAITRTVLTQAAAPGKRARSLVIVPEQYSHETERKLCKLGGDGVSDRAEVLTFSRLAQRVFQELGAAPARCWTRGRLLLMHLAVARLVTS